MSFAFQTSSFAAPSTGGVSPTRSLRGWHLLTTRLTSLLRPSKPVRNASRQRSWAHEFEAMVAAGDKLLHRSRCDKVALSVAVFDLSDLPELRSVFGKQVAQEIIVRLTALFERIATSKGLVARTGPTVFTVLMPGLGRDRALATIREVMGHPCCIELKASREEVVLVPEFLVQTVRRDTGSIAEVYAALRLGISQAQERERDRRRYLQRERESHTPPVELRSNGRVAAPLLDDAAWSQSVHSCAATIPMPLAKSL